MVGIVCFWDRYATPYLEKYEKLLSEAGVPYEVIFWNRAGQNDKEPISYDGSTVTINLPCGKNKAAKICSFLLWHNKVLSIIKKRRYDQLIILSTLPAIFLYNLLIKKYKNNYIFDIRDYTMEANPIFRKLVMNLVNSSVLTPISSAKFATWLDESSKIMVNHNITVYERSEEFKPLQKGKEIINLAFVGNVRLFSQTEALLHNLKGEKRIEQHFYGRVIPSCNIKSIIKEHKIENAFLHGAFDVSQKNEMFKEIDLLTCVYANARTESEIPLEISTALPNKLYDSLVFYKPMVVTKGTYLSSIVEKYHLGISVNGFDADVSEQILNYVDTFNEEEFVAGCIELFDIVLKEENAFVNTIKDILRAWEQGGKNN